MLLVNQLEFYEKIESGDNLEKLLDIYADRLIGFVNSYLKDLYGAEDVMMEVFLQLLQKRPTFDHENKLKAWLFKVAKNKAINYLKHNKSLVKLDENILIDNNEFEQKLYNDNLSKMLIKCMGELKPKYKEVLYLSFFEEMTQEDICKTLDLNIKQFNNIKHRAKQKLNTILKQSGFVFED